MPIQSLLPEPGLIVDPVAVIAQDHRPLPTGRPWVLANMVTTLDGATAIEGVSGPLGGPADKQVFSAIRSVADAVLVGAATVAEEQYRPPTPSEAILEARRRRGGQGRLTIAVVTSSLSLDLGLPLFTDSTYRPLILTVSSAPRDRREAFEAVADVVNTDTPESGDRRVDLNAALVELRRRGHNYVLSEGGPSLNGQLVGAGLVDEWNLTLSPLLAGGTSRRPAQGPPALDTGHMTLTRLWKGDDLLFGRWVRAASSSS